VADSSTGNLEKNLSSFRHRGCFFDGFEGFAVLGTRGTS
jgi:hypothetical protein